MIWKTTKSAVALAMTVTMVALTLPTSADAGHRGKRHHGYYHGPVISYHYGGHRRKHYRHRHYRKHDAGAAVAAGIIGLTVGALIAGSANRHYHAPRRHYRTHRKVYHRGRPQPYTNAWYRYCAAKYRSFDPASGTFMSYSGVRKLCR